MEREPQAALLKSILHFGLGFKIIPPLIKTQCYTQYPFLLTVDIKSGPLELLVNANN